MITQELLNFITQQLNNGREEEAIRKQLLEANWLIQDIDSAFVQLHFQPQHPQNIQLNHLLSPTTLLNNSWNLYKKKWKTILKIMIFSALLSIPLIITSVFLLSFYAFLVNPERLIGGIPLNSFPNFIIYTIIAVIAFIYSVIIQNCSIISLILFLSSDDTKTGIINLFKKSFPLIIPFWLLTVLQSLIIGGASLFFFIPGLIYLVWFSFSNCLLILENIRGVNALFISREIVKERFWGIVGRILVITIIILAYSISIKHIPSVLAKLFNPQLFSLSSISGIQAKNTLPQYFALSIINVLLILIYSFVIIPFATIYNILLYQNAKQLYAKSFPVPNKKSKILLILPAILGLLFFIIIFGTMIISIAFDPLKRFSKNKTLNTVNSTQPARFPISTISPFLTRNPSPIVTVTDIPNLE